MHTHRGALRAIERQRAAHERRQAAPETSGLARGALGLAATGALALGLAQYRTWKYQERQKKYDAATGEYRAISLRAKGKSHSAEALSAKQSRLVYRILKSGAVRESEGVAKLELLDDGGFEWADGSERAAIRKPESGEAILVSESMSQSPRFACTVRSLGDEQDQCIAGVPPLCAAMATELLCVKAAWGLAKWDIVVRALSKDGEWLDKEYPECSADVEKDVKAGEVRLACKADATGDGSHVVALRKDTCVPLSSNFGWFKDLFGFVDGSSISVSRGRFDYDRNSGVLSRRDSVWNAGTFELVSLDDLRVRARALTRNLQGHNTVMLRTQDPAILHGDPDYAGAIFQATAEHNCLQLRPAHGLDGPATPETGVASYVWDKSQGASCAIACAPGAVVRAYFALDGGKPQTNEDQINTLEPLIAFLTRQASDPTRPLVRVSNGYVDLSDSNSAELGGIVNGLSEKDRETAKGLLRVGWQKNTAVTCTKKRVWSDEPWYKGPGHLVHQVYASPLYVLHSEREWEPLARLVLEAAYEATMLVAVLVGAEKARAEKGTRQKVVLTALGREAGGDIEWVADATVSALAKFERADLDVVINKGGARGIECDLIMSRIRDATPRRPAAAAPVVMYTE